MYEIDKSLLEKIDALELSEKNKAWRKAMKAAIYFSCAYFHVFNIS